MLLKGNMYYIQNSIGRFEMERSFKRKVVGKGSRVSASKYDAEKGRKSAYNNQLFKRKTAEIDFKAYIRLYTPKDQMTPEMFDTFCKKAGVETPVQSSMIEITVPQVKRAKDQKCEYQTSSVMQEAVEYYNSLGLVHELKDGTKKPLSIISLGGSTLKVDFSKIKLVNETVNGEDVLKYPCGLLSFNDSYNSRLAKSTAVVASDQATIEEIDDERIRMIDAETAIGTLDVAFRNQGHFILFFVGEETKDGAPVLSLVDFFVKCYHQKDNFGLINTIYLTATDFAEVELEKTETAIFDFLFGENGPFKFFGYDQDLQYLYDVIYASGYNPENFNTLIESFDRSNADEKYTIGQPKDLKLAEIDSQYDKRSYAYYLQALKLCKTINEVKSGKALTQIDVPIVLVEDYVYSKNTEEKSAKTGDETAESGEPETEETAAVEASDSENEQEEAIESQEEVIEDNGNDTAEEDRPVKTEESDEASVEQEGE